MPVFILVNTDWLLLGSIANRVETQLAWPKGKTSEWSNISFYTDMKHGSVENQISRSVIPSVDRSTNLSCNTLMTGNENSFGFTRVWLWFLRDYDGNWSKHWATQKFWTEIDAARHPWPWGRQLGIRNLRSGVRHRRHSNRVGKCTSMAETTEESNIFLY